MYRINWEENKIMKLINYAEYKHSYAHALEPKLKAINFHANVQHKPVKYIKKIIISAITQPEVRFTDKEHAFFDNVLNHYDSTELYFYVKNAIKKAKETMVYVDDHGELVN